MRFIHYLLLIPLFAACTLENEVLLIPAPQNIIYENGSFEFSEKTHLGGNGANQVNSRLIDDELHSSYGIMLSKEITTVSNGISLEKLGSQEELVLHLHDAGFEGDFELKEEAYLLRVSPKHIQIMAISEKGLFYGIQTLRQLIQANSQGNSIQCLAIYDYPDFPVRAYQDDISRGPIPTMEFLKEQIRMMALFKLNYFTLYTENSLKLDSHPAIAAIDALSKDEIEELVEFAKQYHIELIGNFQSFGHMEEILHLPGYEHLAENDHTLAPIEEGTYEFLQEAFEEVVPLYPNKYFNINCDETFGLGEGKSKPMADTMGVDRLYAYHVNKVGDLLLPYDKKLLMWGDIAAAYKGIGPHLNHNFILVPWSYAGLEDYSKDLDPIIEMGTEFWVAPGVSGWRNYYPNINNGHVNIYHLLREGYAKGATGVLNTSWDDDGFNFSSNTWMGMAWGAECSWKIPVDEPIEEARESMQERLSLFLPAFDRIFYGMGTEGFAEMSLEYASLHDSPIRGLMDNKGFFEPVLPIQHEYVEAEMVEENLRALEQVKTYLKDLKKYSSNASRMLNNFEYFELALEQTRFVLQKNLFRANLDNYLNKKRNIGQDSLRTELSSLIHQLELLKADYSRMWLKENRPGWLQENLKKYDELAYHLLTLSGQVQIHPEDTLVDGKRRIYLSTILDTMPIYYSLEGKEPDVLYDGPFEVGKTVDLKASIKHEKIKYPVASDSLIMHKAVGKLYRLNCSYSEYHPSYSAGGIMGLVDGRVASADDLYSGKWQGYSSQDLDIEIDLGGKMPLQSLEIGMYHNTLLWVFLPPEVLVLTSDDGVEYEQIRRITHDINDTDSRALRQAFRTDLNGVETRYIKVVGKYYGPLPEWHKSAGNYSMLFADELIIF